MNVTASCKSALTNRLAAARACTCTCLVFLAAGLAPGSARAQPGACPVADPAIAVHPIEPREVLAAGADAALCEPSAALVAPWDPDLVLVADNERHKQLYALRGEGEGVWVAGALDMPGGNRPRDLEALVPLEGAVMLIGSHGARRGCRADPKRARLRIVDAGTGGRLAERAFHDGADRLSDAGTGVRACLDLLFDGAVPAHAPAFCEALVAGAAGGDPCRAVNVEGAFADPSSRVWLGLRAPLVGGRAALLRLAAGPRLALRFDRVVLLDLDGRGVRELALASDGARVWGIAGPEIDHPVPFRLFSVEIAALEAGDEPPVRLDPRCLPTSSEGLAVRGVSALVLVDGAEDDDEARCASPAGHYTLALPAP